MDMFYEDIGFLHTTLHDVYGPYSDISFDGTNITYKGTSYTPKLVHVENKGFYIELSETIKIDITPYGVYITDGDDKFELIRRYDAPRTGLYIGETISLNFTLNDSSIYIIGVGYLDAYPEIIDHNIGVYLGNSSSPDFREHNPRLIVMDFNTILFDTVEEWSSSLPKREYLVSHTYLVEEFSGEKVGIYEGKNQTLNLTYTSSSVSIKLNSNICTVTPKYDENAKKSYLEFIYDNEIYKVEKNNPDMNHLDVFRSGEPYCTFMDVLPEIPTTFVNSTFDTITFTSSNIFILNGIEFKYSLFSKMSADLINITYTFVVSSTFEVYELYLDNLTLYRDGNMVSNFVVSSYVENISGVYAFNGPYGIEKFVIKDDYSLTADTLVGNALVEVTYNYKFMILMHNNKKTLTLLIDYNGVTVYAYLNEFSLEVMSTPYLKDSLLYAQGIYRDENNNVIYVKNDVLYLNGTANKCSEINGNTIKFGDSKNFTINVADNDLLTYTNTIHYQNESGESIVFNQINFDLKSLVGSCKDSNVGNISIKESTNPFTGLGEGFELTYSGGTISTYTVVIYESSIAMKFEDFSYSFTVYLDQTSGSLTVSVESKGVLPPPPPPPAPPII